MILAAFSIGILSVGIVSLAIAKKSIIILKRYPYLVFMEMLMIFGVMLVMLYYLDGYSNAFYISCTITESIWSFCSVFALCLCFSQKTHLNKKLFVMNMFTVRGTNKFLQEYLKVGHSYGDL